jgi:uncharacterized SAM-binding protein YcdF (DUF218 family)
MTEIPKYPEVPPLTDKQIQKLTNIVFLEGEPFLFKQKYDLIFVFGGSHPGCWKTAYQAYQERLADKILLTGGIKPFVIRHSDWTYGSTSESQVMKGKLLELGVPENSLIVEDRSTNTLENVFFAKELFDFQYIQSLVFICKSFAAGRGYRTLKKHLPDHINLTPYSFDTSLLSKQMVTRHNWMDDPESRSFIYGEYLRMLTYGRKGDMVSLEKPILGLEGI